MILANEYTVPIQFATSGISGTLPLANHFEPCDRFSKIDYQDFGIGTKSYENLLEPITATVMATDLQKLESNIKDSYSIHDKSYDVNLTFHMSPSVQLNAVPSTLHGAYVNTFNNNIILKSCNTKRGNGWKNFINKPQSFEKDDHNKSQTSRERPNDTNSTKHKIPRNASRNPYEQTTVYNNYRYGNFHNVFTNNFQITHQHNTNNFNKSRFQSNNGKRSRREYKSTNSDDIVRRIHGLMERFTSKAGLFQIKLTPPLFDNKQLAQLDQCIWDMFIKKVQCQDTYFHKLELWKKLYLHIAKLFDRYGLFMVGSTMSGLGTEKSDIDMCLLLRAASNDPRADAVRCLEIIRNSLLSCDFVETPEVIHAKVPILKFKSSAHGFEIDLNCNNSVGIRNTHLLHCYAQLDWRVRPLIIVVKLWAQANCINDAKNMTISSYSLALMVIHYLQFYPSNILCSKI